MAVLELWVLAAGQQVSVQCTMSLVDLESNGLRFPKLKTRVKFFFAIDASKINLQFFMRWGWIKKMPNMI